MAEHLSHIRDGHGHGHQDHDGSGKYIVVFVALCALTGASFFTTSSMWPFHGTPAVGWAFMMVVSCTKAMLVILFFMHLLWEANWKYVLTVPAAMMSLFLLLMLVPDVGCRRDHYSEERTIHAAQPLAAHAAAAHAGHDPSAGTAAEAPGHANH